MMNKLNLQRLRRRILSAVADAKADGYKVKPEGSYHPSDMIPACIIGAVNVARIQGSFYTFLGRRLVAKILGITMPQLDALEVGYCWPRESTMARYSPQQVKVFNLGKRLREIV